LPGPSVLFEEKLAIGQVAKSVAAQKVPVPIEDAALLAGNSNHQSSTRAARK
jgi:hypothetical protein